MTRREEIYRLGAVFLVLLVISLVVFRADTIALAYADHFTLHRLKLFATSNWDFFRKAIAFDRFTVAVSGKAMMFRPGMMGVNALWELVFPTSYKFVGYLSIVVHAITTFGLFLVVRAVAPAWAYFLTAVQILPYAGQETILWRHISVYMIFINLFSLGVMWFAKEVKRDREWIKISALFFVGILFHEVIGVAMGLAAITLVLFSGFKEKQALKFYLIPVGVYALWSAIDYYYSAPLGGISNFQIEKDWAKMAPANVFFFAGGSILAAFVPHKVVFFKTTNPWHWQWIVDYPLLENSFTIVAGVSLLFYLVYRIYQNGVDGLTGRNRLATIETQFAMLYFALVVAIGLGRFSWNGRSYIALSSYYFYFLSYLLLVLLACHLAREGARKFFEDGAKLKQPVVFALSAYLLYLIPVNYAGIRKVTTENQVGNNLLYESALKLEALNRQEKMPPSTFGATINPATEKQYCYGGTVGFPEDDKRYGIQLWNQSCAVKPGMPLFTMLDKRSKPILAQLIEKDRVSIRNLFADRVFPLGEFGRIGPDKVKNQWQIDPDLDPKKDPAVTWAKGTFPIGEFGFTEKGVNAGGLIVGYKNKDNFLVLSVLRTHDMLVFQKKNGKMTGIVHGVRIGVQEGATVSIAALAGQVVLMRDGVVIMRMPKLTPEELAGEVGLFAQEGVDSKQFSDIFFRPVFQGDEMKRLACLTSGYSVG